MRRAIHTAITLDLGVPIKCYADLRERMSFKNTWANSKSSLI